MALLGDSNIDVSELALGGNTFGWTSDESASFAVLDRYAAGGGNFVDTADSYSAWVEGNSGGESEIVLGQWFNSRGNRSDVVLATKVAKHPERRGLSAQNIAQAAEESLKRLNTDYIDLYYAHEEDPETDLAESVAAFDKLARAGKIRAVGLSNFSVEQTRQWLHIAEESGAIVPVALQPHYNLVHRGDYEGQLMQLAVERNLAVMPYFSLASGFLTGKYRSEKDFTGSARQEMAQGYFSDSAVNVLAAAEQVAAARSVIVVAVALAWLRSRPAVVAPIASASRAEQVLALLEGAKLDLAVEDLDLLTEASDALLNAAED